MQQLLTSVSVSGSSLLFPCVNAMTPASCRVQSTPSTLATPLSRFHSIRFTMSLRSFIVLSFYCLVVSVGAFLPQSRRYSRPQRALALVPVTITSADRLPFATSEVTPLSQGIQNYLSSSSQTVSLVERHVPTAEEIAKKKSDFNLWFWGGGVVAPFLATFYYFGFKFWER